MNAVLYASFLNIFGVIYAGASNLTVFSPADGHSVIKVIVTVRYTTFFCTCVVVIYSSQGFPRVRPSQQIAAK
jgi:hypothetical protein